MNMRRRLEWIYQQWKEGVGSAGQVIFDRDRWLVAQFEALEREEGLNKEEE